MIEIYDDTVEVHGFNHAIRGIRNNHNSWDKSDTSYNVRINTSPEKDGRINIGDNDLALMKKLAVAGGPHAKYMRYITVYFDINAPMYWWKEFDTYKVGTVRNSCSTMNSIMKKPFEVSDFSFEKVLDNVMAANTEVDGYDMRLQKYVDDTVSVLNMLRNRYLILTDSIEEKKRVWDHVIQLLPSSYMTKATIALNYQVLRHIYIDRQHHKLSEWHDFCKWIESLPYSELITCTKDDIQLT